MFDLLKSCVYNKSYKSVFLYYDLDFIYFWYVYLFNYKRQTNNRNKTFKHKWEIKDKTPKAYNKI